MINNNDILGLVYKISDSIEFEVNDNGIVTVLEKQDHQIQKLFRKLKFNIPMYKKIELDEYASTVFLEIDGVKTVNEIGSILEKRFGERVNPLYERLLVFLNHIDVNCNYINNISN